MSIRKKTTCKSKISHQPATDPTNLPGSAQTKARPGDDQLTTIEAPTFAATLGNAAWLMSLSQDHTELPIEVLKDRIAMPIMLRQFRLFSKGQQPVAFLTFASASEEVHARIEAGETNLGPKDWRSGSLITVVDCISPFNAPVRFIELFQADAVRAQTMQA